MTTFVTIFSIYIGITFFIGYRLHKRIKNQKDFFLAGRSLGLSVATLGYASNYMGVVFAGAQTAYSVGISGMWYPVVFGLSSTLLALLIAGPFHKMGLFTLPEYLSRRYSVAVGIFGGICIVVQSVLANPISALAVMGGILECTFSLPLQWGTLLAAGVSLVILLLSGWYGTMYVNSLHIVFGSLALLFSVLLALRNVGGLEGLLGAPPGYWSLTGIGLSSIATIIITYLLNIFVAAIAFQSVASTVGPGEARKAILIGGPGMGTLLGILGAILGIEARLLYPGEVALSAIAKTIFSTADVAGVILAVGIFVGLLPPLTNTLMSSSTILIRDIYGRMTRSLLRDSQYIRASRVSLGLLMLVVYAISLSWNQELMKLGLFSFALRSAPLAPLMFFGFIWRKGSSKAAMIALAASSGTMVIWFILGFPYGIHPLYPGLLISVTLFILVSLGNPEGDVDKTLLLTKAQKG